MNNIPEKNRAISILGMHRSGTSAITRGFNLLGVYLGKEKDLVQPRPENPEGYWELREVYLLQDRLLAALKRTWDTGMPLPDGWQNSTEVQPFRAELGSLLKQNFTGAALWGWKDPRSMLLFDLWKEMLDAFGTRLSVVFAVRNPLDVARSLEKRDGIPWDKGLGVWFNYNITALRAVTNIPTVFLSYDRFLTHWEPELRRCAAALDVAWPQDDTDLCANMNSFVRPDLRHSCSTMDDLRKAGAPQPVIRLYELLSGLVNDAAHVDSISGDIDELYEDFCTYSRFYQHDIATSWDAGQQLLAAQKQCSEYEQQLAALRKQPDASRWSFRKLFG